MLCHMHGAIDVWSLMSHLYATVLVASATEVGNLQFGARFELLLGDALERIFQNFVGFRKLLSGL